MEKSLEDAWSKAVRSARDQLRPALSEFLEPYISDTGAFIDQCYNFSSKAPARMLHSLHRLLGIADVSGPDELRVFWLCVCAESVLKLSGKARGGSRQRVTEFFSSYILVDDREKLESHFTRSLGDSSYFQEGGPKYDRTFNTSLTLTQIIGVLYSVRSQIVHGDEAYGFSFSDHDVPMMNHVDVSKDGNPPEIEVYDVSISYQEFRSIFARAGVACIQKCLGV